MRRADAGALRRRPALSPAEAEAVPDVLFQQMDAGRDGVVARAEPDAQVMADFRAADIDGDGRLDRTSPRRAGVCVGPFRISGEV